MTGETADVSTFEVGGVAFALRVAVDAAGIVRVRLEATPAESGND